MGTYKNTVEVEVRERRLGSVLNYHGSLNNLIEKSKKRSLCASCSNYEQCGNCGQENAGTLTTWVKDSVVINHSPIGCGLDGIMYAASVRENAIGQDRQVRRLSTNIQEKDTIYGASRKLEATIDEAVRRFDPRVIFVLSSCVTGIIGDDLESVADEKGAEHGIPVIPIYCEGFKSKMWSSGFDAAYHGIFRRIVKEPTKKQKDLVNVFNFCGVDRLADLLAKVGLRTNYATTFSTIEGLTELSEAACSVQFCDTLSSYITTALEEKYGVVKIKNAPPFGLKWTDDWLREIGEVTGKQAEVERVIEEEHQRIRPELEEYRKILKGKRVFIMTGDTFAYQLANVASDLGMEVAGIATLHHDQAPDGDGGRGALEKYKEDHGDFGKVNVCPKQPYQALKLIKDANPDLLICRHPGVENVAIRLGIPIVPEGDKNFSIAYDGILKLAKRTVRALKTQRIVKNISAHSKLPYTKWWLEDKKEDPYYFESKEA